MTAQIDEPLLVVYDSRAIRETIALLGPTVCRQVIEIDNPDETLEAIEYDRPALVVLCAMTAKTRAFELCARIKRAHPGPQLPVMILSLQDADEARRRALEAGADDALQLSISTEELVAHVRALLAARPETTGPATPQAAAGGALRSQLGATARSLGDLSTALGEHEASVSRLMVLLDAVQRQLRELQRSLPSDAAPVPGEAYLPAAGGAGGSEGTERSTPSASS